VLRPLILVVIVAGCGGDPGSSAELIAVPTQSPAPLFEFGPQACPAALLEGTIVRHDEGGMAVQGDPLFPPSIVVWPHGYVARDVDGIRQLLDGSGAIVAREGDAFSAGGGFYPPDDRFIPCGPIELAPGDPAATLPEIAAQRG
jgi:hypothetical protein